MIEIVIYGAGGVGKGALQIIRDINAAGAEPRYRVLGYLDGDHTRQGTKMQDLEILGDHLWLQGKADVAVVVAIANPAAKMRVVKAIRALGHWRFATLIHPRAWLAEGVTVGQGSIVYALVSANADARLGEFTILNMQSTLGHDAWLGDFCTIAPGVRVLGETKICDGADLGANSVVLPGVTISAWSILGAGAVATKWIAGNATAVGVPAVVIKQRPPSTEEEPE